MNQDHHVGQKISQASRFSPQVSHTQFQDTAGQPGLEDNRHSQPGLEVADPYTATSPWSTRTSQWSAVTEGNTAPEVVPQEFYQHNKDWSSPEVTTNVPYIPEKEFTGVRQYPHDAVALEAAPEQKRKSRRWIWIGGLIAVVVVVAAVVGGVVGSAASRNNSKSAASESAPTGTSGSSSSGTATSSAPTQSATFTSIRSDSKLAVTGYRSSGDINVYLYYQDPDDNLRYSSFVTASNWSSPKSISAGDVLAGTGMGASTIMTDTPPQTEFFFFNTSNLLTGQNFRTSFTPSSGSPDSVDGYPVAANTGSNLAAYWPHTVFQNSNGSLQLVQYMFNGRPIWQNQTLSVSESPASGSGLAIIPQMAAYGYPFTAGVLYRSGSGKLAGYWLSWNETGSDWIMDSSAMDIPETSSIAAFAVAQQTADSMNFIYVLYQDSSNVIQFSSYDEESGWETPKTQDALSGADKGTDITCLTEGVWEGYNALSTAKDMSRCYFQSGGRLKEVIFDGANWSVVGFVAMT